MTIVRHAYLLVLCLLFGASFCREAEAAPERLSYAVVIGNNKSLGRRRPELRYADDDAARYFEILRTIAPGRVSLLAELDRDTARLFPDARAQAVAPSRKELEAVGRRLAAEVRAAQAAGHETEVYFVFAGHGDVERGEGFVEMLDARFSSSDLEAFLRAIPFTRAHVILDSCNSFFMLGVRKPGGRHFATSEDATRALASRLPNVGVFLSTSADGEAFEWSELQSGIFSHVVRSGLLGAADADADGSVSYLELAAFVATATSDVKNPNMRPQVFSRGPGASGDAPIVRLHSMVDVRRFELGDASSLRLRLRDANGLPLLDAHTEATRGLDLRLPEAWARGAVAERSDGSPQPAGMRAPPKLYSVPEAPGTITLAALQDLTPPSAIRGPDETFQTLFARPFGPLALANYEATQRTGAISVYGVSREDVQRMELVLDQISRSERGRRMQESISGIGFGAILTGAGIGALNFDSDLSSGEKTQAKVLGGVLLGTGSLFIIGGIGSLFDTSWGEEAVVEFRNNIASGGDPAHAFAVANQRIDRLAAKRRTERIAGGIIGSIVIVGSTTGLIWSEVAADENQDRTIPRIGWSAGILAGGMILGDVLLRETPVESLTEIWRNDPSLHQYQPKIAVSREGAFLSLTGSL